MTTAFASVQNAIVTALKASPAIAGGRVVAGRGRPMPDEHTSDIAVSIETIEGVDIALSGAPQSWRVIYGVEIRARRNSLDPVVAAGADAVLELVYARMKTTAPPAGVLGWMMQPRIQTQVDEADSQIDSVVLAVDVLMRTRATALQLST